MIGHIKPKLCRLPSGARDRYRNLYCSICRSLKGQFGAPGTLLLNSELTIMLLAFSDHFVARTGWYRCPAKLRLTGKPVLSHRVVRRAAGFSLLLGWLKVLDWETDRPAFYKSAIRKLLDGKANNLLATLSEESRCTIEEYRELVVSNCRDFSYVRQMSNLLSATICIEVGRETEIDNDGLASLSEVFGLIGEAVALADPLIDLKEDIRRHEYNPIVESADGNGSRIPREYEKHRSEYRSVEAQIRSRLDDPESQNALNRDFTATLRLSLERLSSRIDAKYDEFLNGRSRSRAGDGMSMYNLFGKPFRIVHLAVAGLSGTWKSGLMMFAGQQGTESSPDPATEHDPNGNGQPENGQSKPKREERHQCGCADNLGCCAGDCAGDCCCSFCAEGCDGADCCVCGDCCCDCL